MKGTVTAEPAPRPLDMLPSKVENGEILILYKEFKSGLSEKVELSSHAGTTLSMV